MLKTELHVHTRFSPDCATPIAKLVARCQKVGTNCLAITDHNTIKGALAAREIAPFQVIRNSRGLTPPLVFQAGLFEIARGPSN